MNQVRLLLHAMFVKNSCVGEFWMSKRFYWTFLYNHAELRCTSVQWALAGRWHFLNFLLCISFHKIEKKNTNVKLLVEVILFVLISLTSVVALNCLVKKVLPELSCEYFNAICSFTNRNRLLNRCRVLYLWISKCS